MLRYNNAIIGQIIKRSKVHGCYLVCFIYCTVSGHKLVLGDQGSSHDSSSLVDVSITPNVVIVEKGNFIMIILP